MTLHVERYGTGPVVLWTHGFGSSSHVFAAASGALRTDHTVITWDLPGHGRSVVAEDPAEFTVERVLTLISDILDDAGAERAVLGGHSLGGYLSLAYALDHPERVAGLVLVGTGPGYRRDDGRAGWNEMCERFARELEGGGLAGLGGSAELREDLHRGGPGGLILAARGVLPQRDGRVIDGLPRIDVPVLVVVGERDRQFLTSSSYLAAKLPGSPDVPVVIPGAGHAPPQTAPEAFVEVVRSFLAEHHL